MSSEKTQLTTLLGLDDGDPVGDSDGAREGELDGPLLGLFEGDWLGVDVGCGILYYEE